MNLPVPLFSIYGEDAWPGNVDGIHIEPITTRIGLHNWEIRPHRHGDLHQVTWVARGGGILHLEGREEAFEAPRLMATPSGVVHGFTWDTDSEGYVVMLAADLLQRLSPPEDRGLLDGPLNLTPPSGLCAPLEKACAELEAEFRRTGPGRQAGLLGRVLVLTSMIARLAAEESRAAAPVSPEADLVMRFRRMIEADFRDHAGLAAYCERLGVSAARLTRACRMATGRSPLALIHDRLMLEAKRTLAYTSASVAETAYGLGFSDPAYFSRFFQKREGVSPQAFRQRAA